MFSRAVLITHSAYSFEILQKSELVYVLCVGHMAKSSCQIIAASCSDRLPGAYSAGDTPLPFRTESLSPAAPMVLPFVVGE